jgi:SpoIIAA-like
MNVFCVRFQDRITPEVVERELARLSARIKDAPGPVSIVFDLLDISGYDIATRHQYIQWHLKHGSRLRRVAVVTERTLIGAVVTAMGLAARGHIKSFKTFIDAEEWCKLYEERASLR